MIGDYGYVNARIRARFRDVLRPEHYRRLLEAEGFSGFVSALRETAYAPFVPAGADLGGVLLGLRTYLQRSVSKLLGFSGGEPRFLFETLLGKWDVHNIITVLRAKIKGTSPERARAELVPAGSLDEVKLNALLGEPDASSVLELLASWGWPVGRELTKAVRSGNLSEAEYLLAKGYFEKAFSRLNTRNPNHALVRRFLDRMVDVRNAVSVLMLLRAGVKPLGRVKFLPGGLLEERRLRALEQAENYEEALTILKRTAYSKAIPSLSVEPTEVEARMERLAVEEALKEGRRGDPLGIAPGLLYITALELEQVNLRTLAVGFDLGVPKQELRARIVEPLA